MEFLRHLITLHDLVPSLAQSSPGPAGSPRAWMACLRGLNGNLDFRGLVEQLEREEGMEGKMKETDWERS